MIAVEIIKGQVLKTKTSCTLEKIVIISMFMATMIYAFTENSFSPLENKADTTINNSYQTMSTVQLQEEVEKRSINGDLSFAMGIELMQRWTNG